MFHVRPGDSSTREKYYRYLARLNFECAEVADRKVGLLPGYEVTAPPPVLTLCGHAIELALKSFLLQNGVPESEVKSLGHNILRTWQKCKDIETELPKINEEILAIMSDLMVSQRLRYGEKSEFGEVPVYGPLSRVVEECLALCGAPKLSDLV